MYWTYKEKGFYIHASADIFISYALFKCLISKFT